MLGVLLLAESQVLISFLLSCLQRLPEVLHFFLEVLDTESQLEFSFTERLSQIRDDILSFLDLGHVRVCQGLDLILMSLVELIDLILGLLLAND